MNVTSRLPRSHVAKEKEDISTILFIRNQIDQIEIVVLKFTRKKTLSLCPCLPQQQQILPSYPSLVLSI